MTLVPGPTQPAPTKPESQPDGAASALTTSVQVLGQSGLSRPVELTIYALGFDVVQKAKRDIESVLKRTFMEMDIPCDYAKHLGQEHKDLLKKAAQKHSVTVTIGRCGILVFCEITW